MGIGTLASSLGIEILTMGFDGVGKVNGTSCALIPLSINAKVGNGSCNGVGGALGTGGLLALLTPSLKLAAFELFGTTPLGTFFPFTYLLGCEEIAAFGANYKISNPC